MADPDIVADRHAVAPAPVEEVVLVLAEAVGRRAIDEVMLARAPHRVVAGVDAHRRRDRAELADLGIDDVAVVDDVAECTEGHLGELAARADRGPRAERARPDACGGMDRGLLAERRLRRLARRRMVVDEGHVAHAATLACSTTALSAVRTTACRSRVHASLLALSAKAMCNRNLERHRDDRRTARSFS